jgi:hypothetical protein
MNGFEGRRFACVLVGVLLVLLTGCGALGPPLFAINDNENVEDTCFDTWSIGHGLASYFLGQAFGEQSALPLLTLGVIWETTEPTFWPGFNESELNQHCDILIESIGWLTWYVVEGD